ncbi:MAG: response regulator [Thermodesulfobacteriota bacterium]
MKILVVDDSRNERYLLETILRANDYDVVSTVNGADAMEKLRAEPFDMIISDILMPVMDGFQLCREVRGDERLKHTPFVFYTATYTDDRDEELAMKVGGDRFICRPLEPEVFTNVMRNIVHEIEDGTLGGGERGAETESEEEFKLYSERLVKKLEKKALDLKEVNSALAISNAELERFAYTLSHDLKSPLITIRGFITLLGEDIEKEDGER